MSGKNLFSRVAACIAACGVVGLCPAYPVRADIFTVTGTADVDHGGVCTPSVCSLRDAINASTNNSVDDVINLKAGDYVLTLGRLSIGTLSGPNHNLDIKGAGSGTTIVESSNSNRQRVFDIFAGATVTISDITIANGFGNGTCPSTDCQGGGIFNCADLTLTRVVLRDNAAQTDGGAILNGPFGAGMLTMVDCTIGPNNVADSDNNDTGNGGGLYNNGISATLINTTISGNHAFQGGGIAVDATRTTLTNCTVSGNTANSDGGGIVSLNSQ